MNIDEQEDDLDLEPAAGDNGEPIVMEHTLAHDPGTVLELLVGALKKAQDALKLPANKWHAVIVPDDEAAYTVGAGSFDELLAIFRGIKAGQAFGLG